MFTKVAISSGNIPERVGGYGAKLFSYSFTLG